MTEFHIQGCPEMIEFQGRAHPRQAMEEIKIEGLSDGERRYLAHWARSEASTYIDPRYNLALTLEQRQAGHDRWKAIADALHESPYSKEGGQ